MALVAAGAWAGAVGVSFIVADDAIMAVVGDESWELTHRLKAMCK